MEIDEEGLIPQLDPSTYLMRKEVQRLISGCGTRVKTEMILRDGVQDQPLIAPRKPSMVSMKAPPPREGAFRRRSSGIVPPSDLLCGLLQGESDVTREDPARYLLGGSRRASLDSSEWSSQRGRIASVLKTLVPQKMQELSKTLQKVNEDPLYLLSALDSIFDVCLAFEPDMQSVLADVRARLAKTLESLSQLAYWKTQVLGFHFRSWRASEGNGPRGATTTSESKSNSGSWSSVIRRLRESIETDRKAKGTLQEQVLFLTAEIDRKDAENQSSNASFNETSVGLQTELRRALQSTKQVAERLKEEENNARALRSDLEALKQQKLRLESEISERISSFDKFNGFVISKMASASNQALVRVLNGLPHHLGLGAQSEESFFVSVLRAVAGSLGETLTLPPLASLRIPETNLAYYAAALHVIDPICVDGSKITVAAKFFDVHELQKMIISGLKKLGIEEIEADDLMIPQPAVHYALAGAITSLWLHNLILCPESVLLDDVSERTGDDLKGVAEVIPPWRKAMANVIGLTLSSALQISRMDRRGPGGIKLEAAEDVPVSNAAFSKLTRTDFKRDILLDSDFEEIISMVSSHSVLLRGIFHQYSTVTDAQSENPTLCVVPNDVFRLMSDCHMVSTKILTRDNVRSMMQSVMNRLTAGTSKRVDTIELPDVTFPELIVRCAFLRYPTLHVVTAVRNMLTGLSNGAGRVQQDLIKTTFWYDEAMRGVRNEVVVACQQPFREKSMSDIRLSSKNVISFNTFVELFEGLKVVDEHFTPMMLQQIFSHAQEYSGDSEKPALMTFDEFVFAFVCVALYKEPCPYWPMHLRVSKFLEKCREQGMWVSEGTLPGN